MDRSCAHNMCFHVFDGLTKIKAVSNKKMELTDDDDLGERDFHESEL